MKTYIVTEGQVEVNIIQKLLSPEFLDDVVLVPESGRYAAQSMGRTLLTARQSPVVLLLDADSDKPDAITERRTLSYELLDQVSPGIPFEVLVAVPEIEAILFHSRPLIENITTQKFNDSEWEFALYSPKETLRELTGMENAAAVGFILNRLSDEDIETLREHPLITSLHEFLARVMAETQESL